MAVSLENAAKTETLWPLSTAELANRIMAVRASGNFVQLDEALNLGTLALNLDSKFLKFSLPAPFKESSVVKLGYTSLTIERESRLYMAVKIT